MSFLLLEEMIVRRGPGTVVENDNRTSQASLWEGTLKTQTLRSDSLQCFGGQGGPANSVVENDNRLQH